MTTRPLHISLYGKKLDVYYVDYLCVAKHKRKQGIAQKLIYTHYVKSRQEHSIAAYLFKREGYFYCAHDMLLYIWFSDP